MHRTRLLVLAAALACVASSARADTVWSVPRTANGKPFPSTKVKIEGVSSAGLMYRSASQDRAADPKPINDIWRIEVEDEKALNNAEESFVAQKWDDAVANYQRAISTSRKDWVKQYATIRLIAAAEKSGKFSAAASAYAAGVLRDPKAADAKPDVPKDKKSELPAAINAVKGALASPRLTTAQKSALQAFLVELYTANDQLKDAQALGGNLAAPAPPPVPVGTGGSHREVAQAPAAPAANKGQVDLKLQLALAALKDKKYQEAIDTIDSIAANLNEPAQQADALFCIAEAKAGLAGNDASKLKDAALAYMRVVAHFKNEPEVPHVAESLYKTGTVLEQAKQFADALTAYRAVQSEYKNSPEAKDAAAAAARVQKAIDETKS